MYVRINKGTHTIQKMVDLANLDDEEKFFETVLTGNVGVLAIDQQGTHIIQKIITSFTEVNRQYVFCEIQEAFLSISKNSHGL
jgi:DNA-binding transcriptional regulator/RsmH inhibitor MraZ